MVRAGLFVIDEAHCISDWGRLSPRLPPPSQGFGSAPGGAAGTLHNCYSQRTRHQRYLRTTRRGYDHPRHLDRESLYLHAINIPSTTERLVWLAQHIPQMRGSGIIYCLTVADTSRIANWLKANGIKAAAYSGETPDEERRLIELQLKDNALKVVASTSALGMGFDKPDLSFCRPFPITGSPVSYYQQVGRAGRAVDHADAILLWGSADEDIWELFLKTSLPVQAQAEQVVEYLASVRDWVAQRDIRAHVNIEQPHHGVAQSSRCRRRSGRSPTEARYRRTFNA